MAANTPPVDEEKLSTLFELLPRIAITSGPSELTNDIEHDLV